jgi:hypothetical protein
MAFRITTEARHGRVVLRVEGWLSAVSVDLLEQACRDARANGDLPVLELSGLRSLSGAEARRLAALGRSGVELTGASGFVAALLREHSSP